MKHQAHPLCPLAIKLVHIRFKDISDEFIPSIVNLNALDEIIKVEYGDKIIMAQKLASKLGLEVAISSDANF